MLYFATTEQGWVKSYAWENCPELPKFRAGQTLEITFSSDFDTHVEMADLDVRVSRKQNGDLLAASSQSRVAFSSSEMSAQASFAHDSPSEKLILSLEATCKRTK
jgi:hypothetical protein